MSSLTNINNNSSVVNVGRTTPVSPGQQPAAKSIPVVIASDQTAIPVVEQNKVLSEVALSLLGIPRSEVALGIFADVNTYDVNPNEWSFSPVEYTNGFGVKHLPEEAGALVEAPKDQTTVLTSKRFFRYQPGRVSSATFGVKSTISPTPNYVNGEYDLNPAIRKFGIFDKFDGYYWESVGDGQGDKFSVVRRTQSLVKQNAVEYGTLATQQQEDHGIAGKAANVEPVETNLYPTEYQALLDNRFAIVDAVMATVTQITSNSDKAKCRRDMDFAIDAYAWDLKYGGNAYTMTNATNYFGPIAAAGTNAYEGTAHTALRNQIVTLFNNIKANNPASTIITNLAAITIAAADAGTQPVLANIDYGALVNLPNNTGKLLTVLTAKKYYLSYVVSEKDSGGNTIVYTPPQGYTVEEIKAKCQRDSRYVIEGYISDLKDGGNAATIYNAKHYYFGLTGANPTLKVYSQLIGGAPAEITRHTYLKSILGSVLTTFGLTSFSSKLNTLCDLIIANFTVPYTGIMEFGAAPQFGDLAVLRDNLIMIHAAVYDPSLLKAKKNVAVTFDTTANTLTSAEGDFIDGQYINFVGYSNSNTGANIIGLITGKLYKIKSVTGVKSNTFTVTDPTAQDPNAVVDITGTTTGIIYINPNVPFIFPDIYYTGENPGAGASNFIKPDGAFPYMYTPSGVMPFTGGSLKVGYIDTGLNPSTDAVTQRVQIDNINLIYNNWIKQNVDPKYYAVYEYRVPRSRFSTDQLNGQANKVVYSDVSTNSQSGRVYAGNSVKDANNQQLINTSVWDLDFTKVTMLKIEFSWYGAVGALFLAYVPAGNGEARWVRVHHLRCSNQLKISSLGNATLPITYLVYGGGSTSKFGITDTADKGYGLSSHHIVKYGASYYIDGGDRGTVRLYSYSTNDTTSAYGSKYSLGNLSIASDNIGTYIDITGVNGLPTDKTFFMKSKIITSSKEDQNVEIIWVDTNRLYINKTSLTSTNGLYAIADRPSVIFGLKAKTNILNQSGFGVRNRVQVYPTQLSTANLNSNPVKLKISKTPLFQPVVTTSGSFILTGTYTVTAANLPLPTASTSYLPLNGQFLYGWFRSNVGTVFGKLYKSNGNYYFSLLETYSVPVTLYANISFLKEGRFTFTGTTLTGESESSITKERLSSVFVSTQIQTPIPGTGIEVASFFIKEGSDKFDLLSFFDYNKDYLSYPLTDQVESLYLTVAGSQLYGLTPLAEISASLTWEEQ